MNEKRMVFPRAPRPRMSCKRWAPGCCAEERDSLQGKFRRGSKSIIRIIIKEVNGHNLEARL